MRSILLPLVPLFGLLWAVGFFRRQAMRSARSLGTTALGAAGMWMALTWLWKNRRDAVSVVAAATLGVAGLVVVAAWWLFPERRLSITAPLVIAGLCAGLAWDFQHTGGARLVDVIAGMRAEARVRNAVQMTHENARCTAVERTADGFRATVDHTGKLDAELVGQALGSGDAQALATDRLGFSTLVLPDRQAGWRLLDREVGWPGPSSERAGDPLRFGFDPAGSPVSIPWPGSGGRHVLVGGSTGSGKSVLLRVLIAEMAYRPNVDLVLCDPKMVEFRGWSARAHVAQGVDATGEAFDAVFGEMMRRYEALPDDQVEWRDADGPWIVLVVDEIAAVTGIGSAKEKAAREHKLGLLLAMGRAAGVGVVGCTQRPSAQVLSMDLRDNFRVRVGLGCESHQQTQMIMGDSAELAPLHAIPEGLQGACYPRVDRRVTMARSLFIPPEKVREIAAATAHNKGEMTWLKAS